MPAKVMAERTECQHHCLAALPPIGSHPCQPLRLSKR